jgi:hypothetical protein
MSGIRNDVVKATSCPVCFNNDEEGTMLAEQYRTKCNTQTCTNVQNSQCGLGLGRDYSNTVENMKRPNDKFFPLGGMQENPYAPFAMN